jgi:prepilin-type N-terminal cleavage/methylation domain-containing protein
MCRTIKIVNRRGGFTLVELLVVMAIILAIAALAAAFAPRITDNTNLSRAVDNIEQWLLTAKMRAKRDGLATGIRLVQAQGDPKGFYSQVQYIQQPDPLTGGWMSATQTTGSVAYGTLYLTGGVLHSAANGAVHFFNVDFWQGGLPQSEWLVQPGDYLEVRDGGVYLIGHVPGPLTITLANAATAGSYDHSLSITSPGTTNYRILRQPRLLIGEEPLLLPNNFAIDTTVIPNTILPGNTTSSQPVHWSNVAVGSSTFPEVLFSPTGAVVGSNAASSMIFISVYDTTMNPFDDSRVGIVAVQTRTGFIGAYSVAPGSNPFYFAQTARESGL